MVRQMESHIVSVNNPPKNSFDGSPETSPLTQETLAQGKMVNLCIWMEHIIEGTKQDPRNLATVGVELGKTNEIINKGINIS